MWHILEMDSVCLMCEATGSQMSLPESFITFEVWKPCEVQGLTPLWGGGWVPQVKEGRKRDTSYMSVSVDLEVMGPKKTDTYANEFSISAKLFFPLPFAHSK